MRLGSLLQRAAGPFGFTFNRNVSLEETCRYFMLADYKIRGFTKQLVLLWIVCLLIRDAGADMSKAEYLGRTAGRVLGAAQSCGAPSERLQATARLAFGAIDQLARSEQDRTSADQRMRDGL